MSLEPEVRLEATWKADVLRNEGQKQGLEGLYQPPVGLMLALQASITFIIRIEDQESRRDFERFELSTKHDLGFFFVVFRDGAPNIL